MHVSSSIYVKINIFVLILLTLMEIKPNHNGLPKAQNRQLAIFKISYGTEQNN